MNAKLMKKEKNVVSKKEKTLKKLKKAVYLLLIVCCAGCKGKEDISTEEVINITIDINKSEKADISEYVDSVRYIKLQTTDDNLIGFIKRVFFLDDRILVTDGQIGQILIFDNEGNFLNKIKKIGQGPGEYTGIAASLFDHMSKSIIIYNISLSKMLFYTLDGKFIKEISGFNDKAFIRDMINLPNGNFLCYTYDLTPEKVGEKASGLWEVDSSGNFVRSFFTIDELYPVIFNYDNSQFTLLPEGKLSVKDAIWSDIYHFDGDSLKKYISYEIKDNALKSLKGVSFSPEKYIASLTSQDKGNFIFTAWSDGIENFVTVYSKKEHKNVLIYPKKTFWSEQKIVEPLGITFTDSNNPKILVTSITGDNIADFLKDNNASTKVKNELKELINGLNEREITDMNPVLQLLYIK
jgi:hypothetical protein